MGGVVPKAENVEVGMRKQLKIVCGWWHVGTTREGDPRGMYVSLAT